MNWLLAGLLLSHGMAHLPGFLVNWKLWEMPELPYRTTAFGGVVQIGDLGTKILGAIWLATGVMFGVLAIRMVMMPDAGGGGILFALAIATSTALCLAVLPSTRWGLVVNGILTARFIIQ